MQRRNKKTLYLTKQIGKIVRKYRIQKKYSGRMFAYEYDMPSGNISKIENGLIDCKVTTLWKISEALGMKFSEFAKAIEEELGEDFKLTDE